MPKAYTAPPKTGEQQKSMYLDSRLYCSGPSYQLFTIIYSSGTHTSCKEISSKFEFTEQMLNACQKNQNIHKEQSSQIGDDCIQSMAPVAADRGRETACCDLSMSSQSEETAANVKGENLYSEIASTSQQPGLDGAAMDRKSETTYSELRSTREPTKGASLGQAVGSGLERTGVPPEEALYDQPVR